MTGLITNSSGMTVSTSIAFVKVNDNGEQGAGVSLWFESANGPKVENFEDLEGSAVTLGPSAEI